MATAQTGSGFFEKYDFQYRPQSTLYAEFYRLARKRGWKQGSKSKAFEKAWKECFGSEFLVGFNIIHEQEVQRERGQDDTLALLAQLQSLDLGGELTKRERKLRQASWEFTGFYGIDAGVLGKWQMLCRDCGIKKDPLSITQCKKVGPEDKALAF
ncbi:MAG: hypothetical protein Q9198_008904 [Flavoplaca austrocitrina]